ncbi:hypothetical protein HHI36_013298 [Cryptolaemus montrouzieri]|uniref:Uncharacterized protein n=1 Tax=Cryptolaemus montrouzieri TaxID=559131 RepID=A0ABD2NH19_9CUCU
MDNGNILRSLQEIVNSFNNFSAEIRSTLAAKVKTLFNTQLVYKQYSNRLGKTSPSGQNKWTGTAIGYKDLKEDLRIDDWSSLKHINDAEDITEMFISMLQSYVATCSKETRVPTKQKTELDNAELSETNT